MSLALLSAGMSAAQGILGYQADKAQSKADRLWQQYSNTMTSLSDAMTQNVITQNEILALEASTDLSTDIQVDRLRAEGSAVVNAAASGIKGVSVRQQVFDVQRSASIAEGRRVRSLSNQFLSFDQQRLSSTFTAEMKKNHSYIPKPRAAEYILKAAPAIFRAF